jgi:hypothetical protein
MDLDNQLLTSETIRMLVSSVTDSGNAQLSELEAERLLNAIARVQSGVPTGVQQPNGRNREYSHVHKCSCAYGACERMR